MIDCFDLNKYIDYKENNIYVEDDFYSELIFYESLSENPLKIILPLDIKFEGNLTPLWIFREQILSKYKEFIISDKFKEIKTLKNKNSKNDYQIVINYGEEYFYTVKAYYHNIGILNDTI